MSQEIAMPMSKQQKLMEIFMPQTYDQAVSFCEKVAREEFIPTAFKNKPMSILLAWQMGIEVGLNFFAAIQNIAVINGRPCLWGDAALAIVQNHSAYEFHKEWSEGSIEKGDIICYCAVKRKTNPEASIKSFSISQAIRAGLWEKSGPWKQYPERMLQMRARGFALRDSFSDALRGLQIAEEVIDIPKEDYSSKPSKIEELKQRHELTIEAVNVTDVVEESVNDYEVVKELMVNSENDQDLIKALDKARSANLTEDQRIELRVVYKDKLASLK